MMHSKLIFILLNCILVVLMADKKNSGVHLGYLILRRGQETREDVFN